MARLNIPVVQMSRSTPVVKGVPVPTASDVANGNQAANDGFTFLEVTNANAGATRTFAVELPNGSDGQAVTARSYTVPIAASTPIYCGPYPTNFYGNLLLIDSSSTDLTFRAISLA
jgi:hypothetical protein